MSGPAGDYLRRVRRGDVALAEVLDRLNAVEQELARLRSDAAIPPQPDRDRVNGWLHRSYTGFWAARAADNC